MATGTITEAKRDETENGIVDLPPNGTFHRWLVSIQTDGGDAIDSDILRKPDSPNPKGEPVEQKPNGRWKVAAKEGGFSGGGKSKDFKADPIKLRGENARSALHAAKDLVVADKIPLSELPDNARRFYSFIEEKAKVDE